MWMDVKSEQYRDGLLEDFLARRNRLRQRFDDEKVGVANLQFEEGKTIQGDHKHSTAGNGQAGIGTK